MRDKPYSGSLRPTTEEVKVWDPLVRTLHWSLVLTFAITFITGDEIMDIHRWAGYVIIAIISLRLVWGVIGTRHARFSGFVSGPQETKAYLLDLIKGRAKRYLGHNPAGAVMIVILLTVLVLLIATGLLADRPIPFAKLFEEVHEVLANVALFLVGIHVAGVLVSSLLHGENLVRAMVTGRKPANEGASLDGQNSSWTLSGIAILVGAFAVGNTAVASIGDHFTKQRAAEVAAVYSKNCSDCHDAYHPSLLTGASWQAIMADLSDHFGEDASLKAETTAEITTYLVAHGAETWETSTSYRFQSLPAGELPRMTASSYWQSLHDHFPKALFQAKSVSSKANCSACHQDALGGGFRHSRIHVPDDAKAYARSQAANAKS